MNTDFPPLVIVLLTYVASPERLRYALDTIRTARANLVYPNLLWYIGDDGSPRANFDQVLAALDGAPVLGYHSERKGYGTNATKAWYMALQHADLALFLEDDWITTRALDLAPYARLLEMHADVGMVRLSVLPINLACDTCGYDGRMYLRMRWESPYAFSGNPALRHRRAREVWGAYPEGLAPGNTEVAYDAQVRARRGPCILHPVELGAYGAFGHIGQEKSY